MFSDYVDEFPQAIGKLSQWIKEGALHSPVEITGGLESTPEAFCRMLAGTTRGKCLVKVCRRMTRAPLAILYCGLQFHFPGPAIQPFHAVGEERQNAL